VRAEPATAIKATAATGSTGPRWLLPAGALLLAGVLAIYLADLASHLSYMAAMRDLVVYRNGGLIVRHVTPAYDAHRSSPLYDWTGQNGVQFTYPPFAAVVFAVASVLSWTAMRWAMTLASLAALGLALWLVFGALRSPGGNDPPQTPPALSPGGTHPPGPPLGETHPPRPPLGGTSPPRSRGCSPSPRLTPVAGLASRRT
jgi:Glycosyltransferase family 87